MRKLIAYILFALVSFSSFGQYSFQKEKNKYWIYRERLKTFMVSGNCKGCDIPSQSRGSNNVLNWEDSPWFIGYWIGALAMEYQLLTNAGLSSTSPEVMQTKEDLYLAIQSINRLDWEAEVSWGCSQCVDPLTPCTGNINGFLLNDDVPTDFSQVQSIIDGLNEGLVPPPDGYRDKCISSAYTEYLTPGREASLDHLIGLYIGLSLVKKYIPASETWTNTPFMDEYGNTTSFVTEVQIISQRIVNYLSSAAWIYINPCANRCVIGIYNDRLDPTACGQPNPNQNCSFTSIGIPPSPPNCCEGGGALAVPEAIGFAAANQFIQGNAPDPLLINLVTNSFFTIPWNAAIDDGNRLPITLAAIGNIWKLGIGIVMTPVTFCTLPCFPDFWHCCNWTTINIPVPVIFSSTTAQVSNHLVNAGKSKNWEHLYLLHKLLYSGGSAEISNPYYECLLNAAPCRGFDGQLNSDPNVEWGLIDRLDGSRADGSGSSHPYGGWSGGGNNGIGYMFYFNLYNLNYNLNYPPQGSFAPIPIKQLAPLNLLKDNYTEYDKKNFMAANSITANTYTITSDPTEGQGRVTFAAGQKITLGDGFKVTNGGYFHGYIDPAIDPMNCSDPLPSQTDCSGLLKLIPPIEPDTITDMDSVIVMQNPPSDSITLRTINQNNTIQQTAQANYGISIIPNPSPGIFTLICQDALQSIEVRDILGNIIFMRDINNQPVNMDVDITTHPPGLYFLKAQSRDKIYTEKIILQ